MPVVGQNVPAKKMRARRLRMPAVAACTRKVRGVEPSSTPCGARAGHIYPGTTHAPCRHTHPGVRFCVFAKQ